MKPLRRSGLKSFMHETFKKKENKALCQNQLCIQTKNNKIQRKCCYFFVKGVIASQNQGRKGPRTESAAGKMGSVVSVFVVSVFMVSV